MPAGPTAADAGADVAARLQRIEALAAEIARAQAGPLCTSPLCMITPQCSGQGASSDCVREPCALSSAKSPLNAMLLGVVVECMFREREVGLQSDSQHIVY